MSASPAETIRAIAESIARKKPKADLSKLASLGDAYGQLSTAFDETKAQTTGLTSRVTEATTGVAADAFERYANRHNASMATLSTSAAEIQAGVQAYADAVKKTQDHIAQLHGKCVALYEKVVKACGPSSITGGADPAAVKMADEALGAAQNLDNEAADAQDWLAQIAHLQAGKLDKARVSPHLPEHAPPGRYAFEGSYGVMGIHTGVVWPVGTHFRENSDVLSSKIGAFFKTADGAASAFGDDPAGHAFARGHRTASAFMTTEGNAAAERLDHIGSGIHGMVQRHNEMQNRVTGHMDDTRGHLDALTPWQPQIGAAMQRAERHAAAAPHHASHGTHPLRSDPHPSASHQSHVAPQHYTPHPDVHHTENAPDYTPHPDVHHTENAMP
jgi:hypothetical protein